MNGEGQNGHEPLLTVREVAQRLRVDETTVRRWIGQGLLGAVLLPGSERLKKYRIRKSALDALMAQEKRAWIVAGIFGLIAGIGWSLAAYYGAQLRAALAANRYYLGEYDDDGMLLSEGEQHRLIEERSEASVALAVQAHLHKEEIAALQQANTALSLQLQEATKLRKRRAGQAVTTGEDER